MCWKCWMCICCCSKGEGGQQGLRDEDIPPQETKHGLKLERKTNWKVGYLGKPTYFVHCSAVEPETVWHSGGIDPRKSKEWVEDNHGSEWLWHRFVFAFRYDDQPPVQAPPKAAELQGFAAGGFMYLFNVPAHVRFMCRDAKPTPAAETGFPDPLPYAWLVAIYSWDGNQATPVPNLKGHLSPKTLTLTSSTSSLSSSKD